MLVVSTILRTPAGAGSKISCCCCGVTWACGMLFSYSDFQKSPGKTQRSSRFSMISLLDLLDHGKNQLITQSCCTCECSGKILNLFGSKFCARRFCKVSSFRSSTRHDESPFNLYVMKNLKTLRFKRCDCFQNDGLKARMSVECFPALVTHSRPISLGPRQCHPNQARKPGLCLQVSPDGQIEEDRISDFFSTSTIL